MAEDLTTLERVKEWLDIKPSSSESDATLRDLISGVSGVCLNYMNRDSLRVQLYREWYEGYGSQALTLRQSPVVEVQKMEFDNIILTEDVGDASPGTPGFMLDRIAGMAQQTVHLRGYRLPRGRASVRVTYLAGCQFQENLVVAGGDPYVVRPRQRLLGVSEVLRDDGSALAATSGAPGPGQYRVLDDKIEFSSSDANLEVLVTYSGVPFDIERAVVETVGERFRSKSRIGENSKSLGGQQTVSFSRDALNQHVRATLAPYQRNVPA